MSLSFQDLKANLLHMTFRLDWDLRQSANFETLMAHYDKFVNSASLLKAGKIPT